MINLLPVVLIPTEKVAPLSDRPPIFGPLMSVTESTPATPRDETDNSPLPAPISRMRVAPEFKVKLTPEAAIVTSDAWLSVVKVKMPSNVTPENTSSPVTLILMSSVSSVFVTIAGPLS